MGYDGAEIRNADELDQHQTLRMVIPPAEIQPAEPSPWWPQLHSIGRGVSAQSGLKAWDPWLVRLSNGSWRGYFLTAWWAREAAPFWFNSDIATAVSYDGMRSWVQPAPVEFSNWEYSATGIRLLAGDAGWHNNAFWLLFSTGTTGSRVESDIALATSADGITFKLVSEGAIARPAQWQNNAWRDPFLVVHEGQLVAFVSGRAPRNPASSSFEMCNGTEASCERTQYQGAIAVVRGEFSATGPRFGAVELKPASQTGQMCNHTTDVTMDSIEGKRITKRYRVRGVHEGFWEMERPQVVIRQGAAGTRFHMFFNCWSRFVNPQWSFKHLTGGERPSDSALYHLEAAALSGPYVTSAKTPIVPGSALSGMYGIRLIKEDANSHLVLGWYLSEFSLRLQPGWRMLWDADGEPRMVESAQ